jgi:GTP diphosphokinase / guanosine-3',5'-bis(diphosphate) 3'-diphosphatase
MLRQFELIEKLKSYDPNLDEDLVNRAYVFSMKAHGTQTRASGEPYFSHPLEVATILVDLHMDSYSIITGLLHDTVEDTLATLDEIQSLFGPEIAKMVDGVTKLSRLELQSEKSRQAENFRKLVLAMSSDIRILLVKLADRLHNMRTLHYVPSSDKRRRVARETMDIYVPLAERMGMQAIKDELEDLAFAQLNPEARESVLSRLRFLHENTENHIQAIIEELTNVFRADNLQAQVSGREKTPFSIWRKMQLKNIAFEQLSDIMAFRVIVDSTSNCYQALGIVHSHYSVVPGRFKDYISTPKPNNYQSLHTSVIGPFNHRVEIQIRTKEMHQIAEYGVAAHWDYKQGESSVDGRQYAWLRGLLEIMEQASNPEEFLEHTKLEMFQDQVFCFTPKGDLISLPRGSTPIDFAYAVHSAVGDHSVAAKINGRQMPLRTILQNGDQVEIITSKTQNPSPTWERFVVTGKARSRIRRFVRIQQREQFIELGKSILNKGFQHANQELSEKALQPVLERYKLASMEELYVSVGEGQHTLHDILTILQPGHVHKELTPEDFKDHGRAKRDSAISIKGLISGMAVHYAGCCHPLPGDRIVGIVTTGKGITIHTQDCEIPAMFNEPERLMDLAWEDEINPSERYVGRLKTTFLNKAGSLAAVSTAISKHTGNIVNIKVTNRSTDFWEVLLDIEIKDNEHLQSIIAALRSLQIVTHVERV